MPTATNIRWKNGWRSVAAARRLKNRFATARIPKIGFQAAEKAVPESEGVTLLRSASLAMRRRFVFVLFRLDHLKFALRAADLPKTMKAVVAHRIRRTGSVEIRTMSRCRNQRTTKFSCA